MAADKGVDAKDAKGAKEKQETNWDEKAIAIRCLCVDDWRVASDTSYLSFRSSLRPFLPLAPTY
jgi:hypothetical protein